MLNVVNCAFSKHGTHAESSFLSFKWDSVHGFFLQLGFDEVECSNNRQSLWNPFRFLSLPFTLERFNIVGFLPSMRKGDSWYSPLNRNRKWVSCHKHTKKYAHLIVQQSRNYNFSAVEEIQ